MPVNYDELAALVAGVGTDSIRLTDPTTGAGLLTTNTDPTVTGVDPLTGEDAPYGTDVGFGAPLRSFLATGLVNGDLATPPPFPDQPLVGDPADAGYNVPPGWGYSQSGTSVTARWVDGAVTFDVASSGAGTDQAYLEQYAPVVQLGRNGTSHVLSAQFATGVSSGLFNYLATAQYLDATGAATGSASSAAPGIDRTVSAAANGEAGMPAGARYLRCRVGVKKTATPAGSYALQQAFVEQRLAIPAGIVYESWSTGPVDLTTDLSAASMYVVTDLGGANKTLRSISSTGVRVGRCLWLYNMDRSYYIVLADNTTASGVPAGDKIYCPNLADLTVRPQGAVLLMYLGASDDSARRWRVLTQV